MKKIGLLSLLFICATRLMAQNFVKKDTLLGTMKNFKLPGQGFELPNNFKLDPKNNLLGGNQLFRYPGADTIQLLANQPFMVTNVKISSIDHMPIYALPANSRMPVYKLPRSADRMPGSNPPEAIVPAPLAN